MANPHKGEVSFAAGGATYTLSYSANAMCELEEALDKSVDAVVAMLTAGENVRLSLLRVVFWQGLRDHHPEMTLEQTKEILKSVKPVDMGTLIGKAFLLALPATEGGGDQTANPPQPGHRRNGTGPASLNDGSKPV